jgi:hypothetical protein
MASPMAAYVTAMIAELVIGLASLAALDRSAQDGLTHDQPVGSMTGRLPTSPLSGPLARNPKAKPCPSGSSFSVHSC